METEGLLPCFKKQTVDPILSQFNQFTTSHTITLRSILIISTLSSYPMGTRGSFGGGKAAGEWSWPLTSI
jgi:hypothetical protein